MVFTFPATCARWRHCRLMRAAAAAATRTVVSRGRCPNANDNASFSACTMVSQAHNQLLYLISVAFVQCCNDVSSLESGGHVVAVERVCRQRRVIHNRRAALCARFRQKSTSYQKAHSKNKCQRCVIIRPASCIRPRMEFDRRWGRKRGMKWGHYKQKQHWLNAIILVFFLLRWVSCIRSPNDPFSLHTNTVSSGQTDGTQPESTAHANCSANNVHSGQSKPFKSANAKCAWAMPAQPREPTTGATPFRTVWMKAFVGDEILLGNVQHLSQAKGRERRPRRARRHRGGRCRCQRHRVAVAATRRVGRRQRVVRRAAGGRREKRQHLGQFALSRQVIAQIELQLQQVLLAQRVLFVLFAGGRGGGVVRCGRWQRHQQRNGLRCRTAHASQWRRRIGKQTGSDVAGRIARHLKLFVRHAARNKQQAKDKKKKKDWYRETGRREREKLVSSKAVGSLRIKPRLGIKKTQLSNRSRNRKGAELCTKSNAKTLIKTNKKGKKTYQHCQTKTIRATWRLLRAQAESNRDPNKPSRLRW